MQIYKIFYFSGNSWGCDHNGKCCVGCGKKQEEFYGCSDISITGSNPPPVSPTWGKPTTRTSTAGISTSVQTTPPSGGENERCYSIGVHQSHGMDTWCINNCAMNYCPSEMCKCETTGFRNCRPLNMWKHVKSLNNYCEDECLNGKCASSVCRCD